MFKLRRNAGQWTHESRAILERYAGPPIYRGALAIQAGIMRVPPHPRRTGTLVRGWYTQPPTWAGTKLAATVGNKVVYARRQNTDTVNRGYIEKGIAAGTPDAVKLIKAGVQAALPHFWEK